MANWPEPAESSNRGAYQVKEIYWSVGICAEIGSVPSNRITILGCCRPSSSAEVRRVGYLGAGMAGTSRLISGPAAS